MNSQQSNEMITAQQDKHSIQGNEEMIPDEGTSLIDPNSNNNETKLQTNQYKRSYQLSGKTYTYVGPQHSQLDDLFDLLDEKQQVPSKYELINRFRNLVTKTEEWCKLNCSFFNGQLILTPYYIFVTLTFICIYITQMVQSLTLLNDSQVKSSDVKSLIVQRLPLYGALFTIFAIIYIQIISAYIKIFLFLFGTLFPIAYMTVVYLNLLNFFSEANYDYEMIILLSTISGTVFNGIIVQSLYQWIKSFLHEIYSTIFASGWCILVSYFIGFYVISFILTINQITYIDLVNYLLGKLYLPLLALLIFSWFILKARLFDWPNSVTETAISRLIKKLEKLYVKPDDQKISTKWFNKNQFQIISYSIGILYIFLEIYLLVNLANIVGQEEIDYKSIITYSVIIIGIPVYLFAGILIAVNNRQPSRTFLLTPLIFGGPLIFALIKLGIEISNYEETVPIIDLIYYSPLILLIIWLTLNLIGIEQRKIQLYTLAFICYFIALPIGVLYPLYQLTNNSVYMYLIYILIIIASCVLIYLLIKSVYQGLIEFRRIKTLASQDYPDFGEFSSYNLTNFAHWINSAFFLLTFFYLTEYFWYIQYDTDNQATDTEIGTIYGLMIIHPLIFILINLALSSESLEITSEYAEDNNLATEMENIKNKNKLEKNQFYNIIIAVLIILIFAIFYPLGYLQSNLQLGTMFFVIAFGVPACLLLFKMLQIIKNKSELYENFFQPFMSIFLWCCIIFPLGLVVPILSVQFQNNTEEFQVFAQLAVAMGLFVCILGVTGLSLFFSILLNKEEFERKKREVLKLVMQKLEENHVLNDLAVVSLLYMKFIQNLTKSFNQLRGIKLINLRKQKEIEIKELLQQKMIDDLIQGIPVNVISYSGPLMTFDHKLVGKREYDKLQQHIKESLLNDNENKQKSQSYCFKLLTDCLCCRCGLEEINELNNQRDQEIINLRQLLRIDENHDEIISHLLPGFKEVQRLDGQPNPMIQLELDPQARILNNKQLFKPIEEIYSSKTEMLMEIQKKILSEKAVAKSKTTDYYKSLELNDVMIAEFMHEVFMEFSNQDQDLPPTICYNDFAQFSRLSEIQFTLFDYKRFAKSPWINQTNSMSEIDFANLMKSLSKPQQNPFDNLKSLILEKIYPNLILNIKTLMYNLKSNNRQVLKNTVDQNTSPFLRANFNSDYVFYEKNQQQKIKLMNDNFKKININENNNNINISKEPVKSKQQRKLEFEQQQQKIREEYLKKLPIYKRCCYQCCNFINRMCCQKIVDQFQNMFGAFSNKKKEEQVVIDVFGQRQMMPPWKIVCKIVIETLFEASDEYDKKYRDIQNQGFAFRISVSNILVLIFRFQDLYGLAALSFNSQVGWFGQTEAQSISISAITNNFEISFWLSVSLALTYGVLGIFAADRVQKNTYGLDEAGNVAVIPHPQFFLTKSIQTLSGQFLLIMTTFLDSFVCDYNVFPYTMVKLDSVECLSNYHFMFMGLAFVCAAIYYPLSTFLQPTFQFSDHSLDLKYKSSYLIIYIQCKLLMLGLSSVFSNFDQAFIYQLSFSTMILLFLIILYMRMEPCYVKWFNVIELIVFLMILAIYVGAIIIMLFSNHYIGLIFSIVVVSLLLIFMIVYVVRNILGWRGRAQVLVSDDQNKNDQVKLSQKKQQVDIKKLILEDSIEKMNENQIQKHNKFQIIQPFEGSPLSFDLNQISKKENNNDLREMKNIQGQINLEQVDVQQDQQIKKKKF